MTDAPPPAPKPSRRRWPWLVAGILVTLLVVAGGAFLALSLRADGIVAAGPRPAEPAAPALLLLTQTDDVFASRGAFAGADVGAETLPDVLVRAVTAIEDRRFFEHGGIDFQGVARAAWANYEAGDVRQGGSTITQQLAKMEYLKPERSFRRKAEELFLALALERRYAKKEILARYLNRAYFGAGAHGIDGAARRYFEKPVSELTLAEAALLAGLLKAPSSLAPTTNPEAAQARAARVLDAMADTGAITAAEAAAAKAKPAQVSAGTAVSAGAGYFADWAAEAVLRDLPADGQRSLLARTTLDPQLQRIAEAAVEAAFKPDPRTGKVAGGASQAAVVVMMPDGAVLAMVGGRDYRASQFNRATRALRQPGSAFKPFVYLAALERGLPSNALYTDGPIAIGDWRPENVSGTYAGPMTMEAAFANSVNTVAVQIIQQIGPDAVVDAARRLGIASDLRATPSLALGTSEVTLLELTSAYAGIAAGGVRRVPYVGLVGRAPGADVVRRVKDPADGKPATTPIARDELVRLMSAVVEHGTGRGARIDRPAAGKTGTSQEHRDAWFVGFTNDLVVGVWVGNDDGTPMDRVTGGGLPARIWRDVMTAAYRTGRWKQIRPLVGPRPPEAWTVTAPPGYAQQPTYYVQPVQPQPAPGGDLRRLRDGIFSIFR